MNKDDECCEKVRRFIEEKMDEGEEGGGFIFELLSDYWDRDFQTMECSEIQAIPQYEYLSRFAGCDGFTPNFQSANKGEGSAGVLVSKHATSPEALRHKVAYDEDFQSTPERVKYREELNRERRKRGIMGHGGPDMSHTRAHTLVAEDPHANRARHFKERGTLKSVAVQKRI